MPPLIAAFLLVAFTPQAFAQQIEPTWVHRYNGPSNLNDHAKAVAVDTSGNSFVTGISRKDSIFYDDYYTAKYAAADGALLWERRYDGPAQWGDHAEAIVVDSSGNAIVTGDSANVGPGGIHSDFYTAKYASADGSLLWETRYNGPQLDQNSKDIAYAVATDASDNVIVTGTSTGLNRRYDIHTAKYAAANGAVLWSTRYNGTGDSQDAAMALAVDGSGNVAITGHSVNPSGNKDYYTAKYAASDGHLLWENRYDGPGNADDSAISVVVDAGGNVIVTGTSRGTGSIDDFYTAKYRASDGNLIWERRSRRLGSLINSASGAAVDGGGNVVVTGSTSTSTAGRNSYCTAKYAASDGALLWEKYLDLSGQDTAVGVVVDSHGNAIVTGTTFFFNGFFFYTVTYAAGDGAQLCGQMYVPPTGLMFNSNYFSGGRKQTALTPNDGLVIAGTSNGDDSNYDYLTFFYAPAISPLQSWRQQYFATTANSGNAADSADPDYDNLPNLMEWGCGSNPTVATPPPGTPEHNGTDFTFHYPRSTAALTAGAVFAVEWSDSLADGAWQTAGVSETVLSTDGTLQQVRASLPADATRRYVRLRVTAPP